MAKSRRKQTIDAEAFCEAWCEAHRTGKTAKDLAKKFRMNLNAVGVRAHYYRKRLAAVGLTLPKLQPSPRGGILFDPLSKPFDVAGIARIVVEKAGAAARKEYR
ncbi:MAG: hypothetical protein EBT03_08070 [Betaproteobacteria bacterium]|nr:hypothetical protein [Betaproteobacteria bacterium]NCA16917.1 hypothetical protein [Betaproteobacteria bacterium]